MHDADGSTQARERSQATLGHLAMRTTSSCLAARWHYGLLVGVSVAAAVGCASHTRPVMSRFPGRVTVVDMTPKFLAFYDSATARHADADARWELWQRLYNFGAVPPTAFGREMARRLLDSRPDGSVDMREVTRRVTTGLASHRDDRIVPEAGR